MKEDIDWGRERESFGFERQESWGMEILVRMKMVEIVFRDKGYF